MPRYTVTIVSPGRSGAPPTLIVPFEPSARVTALIDELWRRVQRHGLSLEPATHIATLHLDSETGALIDFEDVISDVITDPATDKLFAVFATKEDASSVPPLPSVTRLAETPVLSDRGPVVSVRVITAATAKDLGSCPILQIPASSTIRDLHEAIGTELLIRPNLEENSEVFECNCRLAQLVVSGPSDPDDFFVIHGKSIVERLPTKEHTEVALRDLVQSKFGVDIESRKRVSLYGVKARSDLSVSNGAPVAAICSIQRHTPAHAHLNADQSGRNWSKTLDLHTTEAPIQKGCLSFTIDQSGLRGLEVAGIIDIFVVNRTTSGSGSIPIGKSSIYRNRSHWAPSTMQSDRGLAMLLSSLRVFISLLQGTNETRRMQDAVLHVIDLLTAFLPAVRSLYILLCDKTPTAADSAAISTAMFEVLDNFLPEQVVGTDHSRAFEGARLLLAFILEKARSIRLPETENVSMPYLDCFRTIDLMDCLTNERVMCAVQIKDGLVESRLLDDLQERGLLATKQLQKRQDMSRQQIDPALRRQALLSEGASNEVVVCYIEALRANYRYEDDGKVQAAFDITELSDLCHLADLCGRQKLVVHRPSQLVPAIAPCLTFDRNAHAAVYTGEQPCGDPGHSSMLFRPTHGEETADVAIIEQLIAPILNGYKADGSMVFDEMGGAVARRLQTPDEILMFAVDTSASMRSATDFAEISDLPASDSDHVQSLDGIVESEFYTKLSFPDIKEQLCDYEAFNDMLAIVADKPKADRCTAGQTVEILRIMLGAEIVQKTKTLQDKRERARNRHSTLRQLKPLEDDLKQVKAFWAGLQTHEAAALDFILYRAHSASANLTRKWQWSLGDQPPELQRSEYLEKLDDDITCLPHNLRCPISHLLMEDAVAAVDGAVYSKAAIDQWFNIRHSSPLTGLALDDISLTPNSDVCDAALRWINGDGLPAREGGEAKRLRSSQELHITFDCRLGPFERLVGQNMTLADLYKLAFRALRGRFLTFQLHMDRFGALLPDPSVTVGAKGISDGDRMTVHIAEEEPVKQQDLDHARSSDHVLVKVYSGTNDLVCGYWVNKDTPATLASILWKYWRCKLNKPSGFPSLCEKQVWTDHTDSGDGLLAGSPRNATDRLATYFTRAHCFGTLAAEPVYRVDTIPSTGVLVLKVDVAHPWKACRTNYQLSRLDVLKQIFDAMINRMLAYSYKTHVGLITFASTGKVDMSISNVLENFRTATHKMSANGDTALWDALALAQDQIIEYAKKFPNAKKRIVVISDGADTKSGSNTASDVCWRLRNAEIVVDSVALGDDSNVDLRTLSYLLGSYRFHPSSLVNALTICEMEPFLSLSERPDVIPPQNAPKSRIEFMSHFVNARSFATSTMVTENTIPPRKQHPNLADDFVKLSAIASTSTNASINGLKTASNFRTSRLMTEIRKIVGSAHPTYDMYVSESDMTFWKIVMSGPGDTDYALGVFLIYLHADEHYPTFAPKVRFVTRIKHPNVNMHGRICHSIFDRDWTSDISMTTVLDTVYGLLLHPESTEQVNTATTLALHDDQVDSASEIRRWVTRFARRTREQWRGVILGEVDEADVVEMSDGDNDDDDGMDSDDRTDSDDGIDPDDISNSEDDMFLYDEDSVDDAVEDVMES